MRNLSASSNDERWNKGRKNEKRFKWGSSLSQDDKLWQVKAIFHKMSNEEPGTRSMAQNRK